MINCTNVAAAQAESYYRADDYYTLGHPPAAWCGKGAAALALSETNADKDFAQLLRGRLPNGVQIAGGQEGKHRSGTDLTVSAPKSVSIAALVNGDQRVIEAHNMAVRIALEKVETLIQARLTEKGVVRMEATGIMIVRMVMHDTSREGDPNLHTHCVILNVTQRLDGLWVALENREIFAAQKELDQIYKSELAVQLAGLGYSLRANRNGFELADITEEQIQAFSQRKQAIDEALEKRGTSREAATAAEREMAALNTRDRKEIYDREQLQQLWRERGAELGVSPVIPIRQLDGVNRPRAEAALEALTFGIEHLSEREAAWTENELQNAAQSAAWGTATWKDLQIATARAELRSLVIRKLDGTLTTETAQIREKKMLKIEERGRGAVDALTDDPLHLRAQLEATQLNDRQRGAVEAMMTTTHRIMGIQGLAGVGKTTLLDEFRRHAEAAGYRLEGVAPSHSAVKALAEAGIEGKTLQSWEASGGKLDAQTVLVVDESSLVSTKQMAFVLKQAERAGARVVLVGDTGQYQAVDAGKAFAQLQAAGMQTAVVDKMLRQQVDELREVAKLTADGKGAEALMRLGDGVHEIGDRDVRHQQIASHYAALSSEDRKDTLILTGSNADRCSLNASVRAALGLAGQGEVVQVFERGDLTVAEQRRAVSYQIGDALRFEKDYRSLGAARGDVWRVVKVEFNQVEIAHADGRQARFEPALLSGKGFTVGRAEGRELAEGDRIRITGDIPSLDGKTMLRNGQRASVIAVSADRLSIQVDGVKQVLEIDARRVLSLDHGYAATGHSAQGLGAKRVLLERDSQSLTASERQFYTDVTRAKRELVIYTDDRQQLAKSISRKIDKTQALDQERPNPFEKQNKHDLQEEMAPLVDEKTQELVMEELQDKVQGKVQEVASNLADQLVNIPVSPSVAPSVSRAFELGL